MSVSIKTKVTFVWDVNSALNILQSTNVYKYICNKFVIKHTEVYW